MIEIDNKTESNTPSGEAPVDTNKKPYDTPHVAVLGTLLEITRGGDSGNSDGVNTGSFGEI
jgi:hypothetical protein